MRKDVLVAEISGKRPGTSKQRPTEKFDIGFDKVIISNNSDGYETDWDIVDVPEEYEAWYKEYVKTSDLAYYAPMNRSYAIWYARKHGYRYLIQIDDNITAFNIAYTLKHGADVRKYATLKETPGYDEIQNDLFGYLIEVLEHTNAGISGMRPSSGSVPGADFLRERYVYSAFALDLNRVPDYYQGDFEDDIEFRLRCAQMGVPSVAVTPFAYIKTAQKTNNDTSGNRAAYLEAGLKRGETMSKLYGDEYAAGLSSRGSGVARTGEVGFRHKLTSFKVGVLVKDYQTLKDDMAELLMRYATKRKDIVKVTEKAAE